MPICRFPLLFKSSINHVEYPYMPNTFASQAVDVCEVERASSRIRFGIPADRTASDGSASAGADQLPCYLASADAHGVAAEHISTSTISSDIKETSRALANTTKLTFRY
jgi:hypothetical protein